MEIIGLVLLFGVFFAIDFRDLLQGEQRKRNLAVYLTLWTMGLAISMLMATHHTPISPTTLIERLVTSLAAWLI